MNGRPNQGWGDRTQESYSCVIVGHFLGIVLVLDYICQKIKVIVLVLDYFVKVIILMIPFTITLKKKCFSDRKHKATRVQNNQIMLIKENRWKTHCEVKRTLSPYFRNSPLLHITIRFHLTWRLLKFMQLENNIYYLSDHVRFVDRVKAGDNI